MQLKGKCPQADTLGKSLEGRYSHNHFHSWEIAMHRDINETNLTL